MPGFHDRLRLLRLNKGLTQEELGKIVGKSKNNISQYERNARQADDDTKKELAKFFNVSMDYLMGITEHSTPVAKLHDNKEIDEELNKLVRKLEVDDDLLFHGEPIRERTRRVIIKSLKHVKEIAEDTATYDIDK
ncbi:helix-turn-helix transcriptional regulator [Vallitalea pronyensis]|uniref:Helix-turn-helix transcriptional regulator n=1 Tax=Vallitalea pronyensis TaxID=1348613 RepID=A0A8J8SG77_9FIRM|nr:helix-turn-helix domain-containing protein [Vallitalea pronyensis]QUI22018.1 helix-turn-helix transcriptional regulator [Vallitalea pronyensis]